MKGFEVWFKRRRELLGFRTQQDLVSATGLSLKTISDIEAKGDFETSQFSVRFMLARRLMVSEKVMTGIAKAGGRGGEEYLLVGGFRLDLPDDERELLMMFVQRAATQAKRHPSDLRGLDRLPAEEMVMALASTWVGTYQPMPDPLRVQLEPQAAKTGKTPEALLSEMLHATREQDKRKTAPSGKKPRGAA